MPGYFPGRPGGEHGEPLLDMILERRPIPSGAPPEIRGLARVLSAAAGPAEAGDLAGQAAAEAAFTRLMSPPGASPAALRSARRSLSERPARGRLPLAAALAAVVAGLGSTAAAYAGVLPSTIQHFAHVAIGAPARPPDIVPAPRVVTSSPTPNHTPSGSAGKHSRTSTDPVSGQTNPGHSWNHGRKAGSVPHGLASCPSGQGQDQGQDQGQGQAHGQDHGQDHGQAVGRTQNPTRPSPTPNSAKSGSAQGSDGSGQAQDTASLPSSKTACSDGTVPTKEAHAPGQ
jgi:hypothetical protein